MSRFPFLLPLVLFSALTAIVAWCFIALAGHAFTWHYGFLMAYFTIVTFAMLAWQESAKARTNIFIRRFMGGLVMKLMGSLIVFAFLAKAAPDEVDKPLTVCFAGLYAAYLAFSTVRLSQVMRTAGRS